MKKIIFSLIFTTFLYGGGGVLEYELKDNEKNIGSILYQGLSKKSNGYMYKFHEIKISSKELFFSFNYNYKETINISEDGSISFIAYENIDGDKKKVHGVIKDNSVIYKDGTILDISNIDSIPFLLTNKSFSQTLLLRNFSVKTFDPMKQRVKTNHYKFLEIKDEIFFYQMTNTLDKDTSLAGFDKAGNLVYIENKLFQGTIKE